MDDRSSLQGEKTGDECGGQEERALKSKIRQAISCCFEYGVGQRGIRTEGRAQPFEGQDWEGEERVGFIKEAEQKGDNGWGVLKGVGNAQEETGGGVEGEW